MDIKKVALVALLIIVIVGIVFVVFYEGFEVSYDTPEDTIHTWEYSINNRDVGVFYESFSNNLQGEMQKSGIENAFNYYEELDYNITANIIGVDITDDNASAEVEMTITAGEETEEGTEFFSLVREDNKWKLDEFVL